MVKSLLPVASSPGNNLKAYLSFIRKIEILSPMEEQQLALKWTETGDMNAAQSLVMAHLRFVVYIARSYKGYGLPLSDLIQEGNVGLMKAVKKFDPHRGVRLITFAVYWIRSEIHEYILQNWKIVKVATTKSQRKLFFNLRSSQQRLAWLSESEIKDIAEDLEVLPKDVREMEARLTVNDSSFDYTGDDDDEESLAPANFLGDDSSNPHAVIEQSEWEENLHQALIKGIAELDTKSRDVVEARWLSPKKSTLKELAKQMDLSPERIRQIEKHAFNKVREHLRELAED